MGSVAETEVYDLLILVDATMSMDNYIKSLQSSLPQIIQISVLTDAFARIGLLAYRDYSAQGDLLEWSGWMTPGEDDSKVDLIKTAKNLTPRGNYSTPEASKTGLARAYELMRKEATTIVLYYTDAPPHLKMDEPGNKGSADFQAEQKALCEGSYGGYGQRFADWVSAAKCLRGEDGKKAQVFCVLQERMRAYKGDYYNYLCEMTGGSCLYLAESRPAAISKVTVEVLLSWMGVEKAGVDTVTQIPAYMSHYTSPQGIADVESEVDPRASKFIFGGDRLIESKRHYHKSMVIQERATSTLLKRDLPKKATPIQDFAKRYTADPKYKELAVKHVKKIIALDVSAMSLNPVFGSLWRAVCNDRNNPARDELVTSFALKVNQIANPDVKARMKIWLEKSYDYTAEVVHAIEVVPETQRFPCVCFDPTQVFTTNSDGDDEANKPITQFKRDELLEIGRSCDYKILRRLGRVLTRLTYINSAAEMPAHIAAAPQNEIPRIPIALARSEYKRQFWRILLHIVVPGTMLGPRAAALLAALSIRLGVQPLIEAADQEMLLWKNKWNNIEIPETWNMSCLGLLMDADKSFQGRQAINQKGDAAVSYAVLSEDVGTRSRKRLRLDVNPELTHVQSTLLWAKDRALFDRLVSYKMLELNLDTKLDAMVAWTPDKTRVTLGPTVVCRTCQYPRSVTVMGPEGTCGICLKEEWKYPAEREEHTAVHVSKQDKEDSPAIWVECNLRDCQAQYVVYRVETLRVKPKCHYCRLLKTKAPVVECTECLNRIIWPAEYRPEDVSNFKCYACTSGRKTTISAETTPNELSAENTRDWLLHNDNKIAEPFNGRSLFHTISTAGTEEFCEKVELFPDISKELRLNGKLIRNAPSLIEELQKWVNRRRAEGGCCSLCFTSLRKNNLLPACGRSGCHQRICKDCLGGWYGLNAAGRIINTSALSCPFCRRDPAPKTLAKYGMGVHAVGNLRNAVKEKGEWIYCWCSSCGFAKQYVERVCAVGAPAEIKGWSCEDCTNSPGDGKRIKPCPGCGVMTQKSSGCDHITCSVPTCGTHWCFHCGEDPGDVNIYTHMQQEHGGYYGGVAAEDADWSDDE